VGKDKTDPGNSPISGSGSTENIRMESGREGKKMKALEHDHTFGEITGMDLGPMDYCMACEIEAYRAIGTPEEIRAVIEGAGAVLGDDQERRETYPETIRHHPHRTLVMDSLRAALDALKREGK